MKTNIKELREKNGMSQQQLADKLGISRSAVCQWEKGASPTMGNVQRIADIFGVAISDVIDDREEDTLTRDEYMLVKAYRMLNARGKERLLEDARTMIASGMYAQAKNNLLPAESSAS